MKSRGVALAFLLMLVLAGCGARLTREQRLAGIGIGGAGGGGAVAEPGATTGPGVPGATTGPGGGATTGPGAGGGVSAPAPPGGNGGATDKGVAANQITISVASDISGVQGALFKTTHEAMRAWAAYVNSSGGLFGRAVKIIFRDTKAETGANRAAVQDACDDSFALVGSMSAFDNGGASVGEACGIPDITAITVNGSRALAKNVYPVYPIRPDKLAIGTANYIKEKYPNVIGKAGMVYLNAGVTKSNALQRVRGYEKVGFDFSGRIYEAQVVEPNYSAIVQRMKDDGLTYLSMVANYQSIQQLLDAFDKAGWRPTVLDWDSVAYSPNFLVKNGRPFAATEGSLVYVNTGITEESSSNREMQLYIQWLSRVAPGSKPDYFGFYAWSAGQLFVKAHTDAGAKITRKGLLAALANIHSWDGNGLHAAHDIGAKIMSPCFLYLEVKGGRFTRQFPASGFSCNKGGVINT